jgi:hypothetical protein
VVSGVGKSAAAAAVAHLHRILAGFSVDGWINIGVGGHRCYPLGTPILASEVRDQASGESWSPPIPFEPPCKMDRVVTVEQVERVYAEAVVYDMEASAFYKAAVGCGRSGLVQVLKVVSDNRNSGVDSISGGGIERLLEAGGDTIENLIAAVGRRAQGTTVRK